MKSKVLFSVTVFVTMLLGMTGASAKGIFITPGARANGMGGAFNAVADDLSAIYWNPAGLAQLSGKYGVEISGFYLASDAKGNQSLGNAAAPDSTNGDFPLPNIYGAAVEPSQYNSKKMTTSAFLPFVAGYGKVKDITLAVGYYYVGGAGGTWEDAVSAAGVDTINAKLEAIQQLISIYNISAAKEITSRLSVGVGVEQVNMDDKTELSKTYTRGTGSAVPADYNLYNKDTSNGSGIQVNAGALYKLLDNLSASAIFRSGTTLKLKGTNHYRQKGSPVLTTVDIESDYDRNFYYPMTYSIGLAYIPVKKLTIGFAVEENLYSTMKEDITYDTPVTGLFVDVDESSHWKDVTQVRLGAMYQATERLSLSAGVKNDPTPFSRDSATLINSNQYDYTYITLGGGYDFGNLTVAGTYIMGISEKVSVGDRTYEFPLNMACVDVAYRF